MSNEQVRAAGDALIRLENEGDRDRLLFGAVFFDAGIVGQQVGAPDPYIVDDHSPGPDSDIRRAGTSRTVTTLATGN